jgi:transposase
MKITLIGIDLAKNVFQVCGVNQAGKSVFNRAVKRAQLLSFLAQHPAVEVAMEACSGSNYWGRTLQRLGHKVLLIPPKHVKPFVTGNKNDRNDAFAICEAANRPRMVFVQPRSVEQTDMILAHRVRERLVGQRTTLINQLRGLLQEYGIVLAQGKERLRNQLPDILEDGENELSMAARACFQQMLNEWTQLDECIAGHERSIKRQCKETPACQRLTGIKGVAEITATALVAYAGNGAQFHSARHFAANLGLVPREHSSGGKQKLGGITKRGNSYVRRLLVQGAWSIIRHLDHSTDRLSVWAKQLIQRRGKHVAALALANKLARISWAMLYKQQDYRAV